MPHETRACVRHENEAGTESSCIFLSNTLNLVFLGHFPDTQARHAQGIAIALIAFL